MYDLILRADWHGLLFHVAVRIAVVLVCWAFLAAATFVDLYYGRRAAKAAGERLRSRKYRRTFAKIGDYVRVMAFALMFDFMGGLFSWYALPYASILYTVAALLIEFLSVREKLQKTRAAVADVPDVIRRIVAAASRKDAEEIVRLLEDGSNAGAEKGGARADGRR